MDSTFGSLRTAIGDELRDIFGGVQVDISGGGGEPTQWGVSLGERRVLSVGALILAAVVGLLLGGVLFGRKG